LRQTACSTYSRSEWSVVRSASLAKGSTSKNRPSPHLHRVPARSNKVSPPIFQTALVLSTLDSGWFLPIISNWRCKNSANSECFWVWNSKISDLISRYTVSTMGNSGSESFKKIITEKIEVHLLWKVYITSEICVMKKVNALNHVGHMFHA
jgi:hypothetical protein